MAFIKHVNSSAEFDNLLEAKKANLIVIDFHAAWCAPCHAIAPIITRLSDAYRHVTFAKVDIDANAVRPVVDKYRVTTIPMFVFIKNKVTVDQFRGADALGLESLVKKHAGTAPAGGAGESSGGVAGDVSLLEYLDLSKLNCLNESPSHTAHSILSSKRRNTSASNYLLSEADDQLLLNIVFIQAVRIRSIVLHTSNASSGPKKIKLLTNKESLGFEDVESAEEPQVPQVLELSEDTVKEGKHIQLRYVRFQIVNSLHIFIASNHGNEDETRIDAIDIFGTPLEAAKSFSNLKKAED